MNIYYSVNNQIDRLSQYGITGVDLHTGWGKFIDGVEKILQNNNHNMVDSVGDADLELYVGQPSMKIAPSMSPNIVFTMYESSKLPESWVDSLNKWDVVINPTSWGRNVFINSGVNTPIIKILPLWVDKHYTYIERDIDKWAYIFMSVQLNDRKNGQLVSDLFFYDNKLPSDIKLFIKTIPTTKNPTQWDAWVSGNIKLIQMDFSVERLMSLYKYCHVSLNPSAGEGFGYLTLEHMATGMCTVLSNGSALTAQANPLCNIPIDCKEVPSPYYGLEGNLVEPNIDQIIDAIIWSYENREEAMAMGKRASTWVKNKYSVENFYNGIMDIMELAYGNSDKRIYNVEEPNFILEEIDVRIDQMEKVK